MNVFTCLYTHVHKNISEYQDTCNIYTSMSIHLNYVVQRERFQIVILITLRVMAVACGCVIDVPVSTAHSLRRHQAVKQVMCAVIVNSLPGR